MFLCYGCWNQAHKHTDHTFYHWINSSVLSVFFVKHCHVHQALGSSSDTHLPWRWCDWTLEMKQIWSILHSQRQFKYKTEKFSSSDKRYWLGSSSEISFIFCTSFSSIITCPHPYTHLYNKMSAILRIPIWSSMLWNFSEYGTFFITLS